MVTMLLFGVSAPELLKAAGVALFAAGPPKPPASASNSRFFFRENRANMSAPTITQAASMPIRINTAELMPLDSLSVDCGTAFSLSLVSSANTAVADDEEPFSEPFADDEKLLDDSPLIESDIELAKLLALEELDDALAEELIDELESFEKEPDALTELLASLEKERGALAELPDSLAIEPEALTELLDSLEKEPDALT